MCLTLGVYIFNFAKREVHTMDNESTGQDRPVPQEYIIIEDGEYKWDIHTGHGTAARQMAVDGLKDAINTRLGQNGYHLPQSAFIEVQEGRAGPDAWIATLRDNSGWLICRRRA